MSRIVFCVLFAIVICLAGCTAADLWDTMDEIESIDEPTLTPKPTQPPAQTSAPTPTPEMTPEPTPEPTPTPLTLNTEKVRIPNIKLDTTERVNSRRTVYENETHVFYLAERLPFCDVLFSIDKRSGQTLKIAEDCSAFCYYDGKLYIERDYGSSDDYHIIVEVYEVDTGKRYEIEQLENCIGGIVVWKDRLYATRITELDEWHEQYLTLWSADLDGSHAEVVREFVGAFCIYDGRIFYTYDGTDGGSLYEFAAEAGGEDKKIARYAEIDFDIGYNQIFFGNDASRMMDIDTLEQAVYSRNWSNVELLGQYLVDVERNEDDLIQSIMLYDYLGNREYELWDMGDLVDAKTDVDIDAWGENIYICLGNYDQKIMRIYLATIENEEAQVTLFTEIRE